jgi:hypothetical protein
LKKDRLANESSFSDNDKKEVPGIKVSDATRIASLQLMRTLTGGKRRSHPGNMKALFENEKKEFML